MKNYNLSKWEPIRNIPQQLFLEGLYDDYEGLRLLLKGSNPLDKLLKIQFQSYIAYRNVDETYRLKTLIENPILTTKWPLFISTDDDFMEWVKIQSSGTFKISDSCKNYIFCTPNDVVEVLSTEEPVAEWL